MASSAELRGSVAVVTGASSGIGRATAARLAEAGARILLVGRSADRLAAAAAALPAGRATTCVADVAHEDALPAIRRHLDAAGARAGPDILVHAAGAFDLAAIADTSVAAFDRLIAVNLRAAFLLMHGFLPAMLERGSGHIVTIGSVAGRQAFPHNGAYSASKFGVRGLHAVLAAELRGTGVRATFVEPAATDTPLWDPVATERDRGLPPRSAMLSPDAVAEAVLFAVTRPGATAIPNILLERA